VLAGVVGGGTGGEGRCVVVVRRGVGVMRHDPTSLAGAGTEPKARQGRPAARRPDRAEDIASADALAENKNPRLEGPNQKTPV
ncbi:hypothetical protein, partial [Roseibium sp.]|uniref:hypothetical protein n=1 Tax=Roseibium sp. TaxID=1936156 RepID=UPI003296891A